MDLTTLFGDLKPLLAVAVVAPVVVWLISAAFSYADVHLKRWKPALAVLLPTLLEAGVELFEGSSLVGNPLLAAIGGVLGIGLREAWNQLVTKGVLAKAALPRVTKLAIVLLAVPLFTGCAIIDTIRENVAGAYAKAVVKTGYCKLPEVERLKVRDETNAKLASEWAKAGETGPPPTTQINCP